MPLYLIKPLPIALARVKNKLYQIMLWRREGFPLYSSLSCNQLQQLCALTFTADTQLVSFPSLSLQPVFKAWRLSGNIMFLALVLILAPGPFSHAVKQRILCACVPSEPVLRPKSDGHACGERKKRLYSQASRWRE